jgi:hypothetical protein
LQGLSLGPAHSAAVAKRRGAHEAVLTQLRRSPDASLSDAADHYQCSQNFTAKTEPEDMLIALNIVLATLVIVGIVGMLAWSIATQGLDAPAGRVRSTRRRRRTTARAQLLGRTLEHRA